MKERPILFTRDMVEAIRQGMKSQTRRIIKPQYTGISSVGIVGVRCPYGRTGDRLWVKESIFMPRRDSRIILKIIGVRIEKLQEITDEDAMAEGVGVGMPGNYLWIKGRARQKFRTLWDSLNAKKGYGWDTNPLVWVIEFKRIAND